MASYLERLIKVQAESYGSGVTTDPFTGGFILPDGRFLNMGMYGSRGDDHRIITHVLPTGYHEKYGSRFDALAHVARVVNLVRWQPENWSFSIFTKPTPQQLATIQHLVDWKRMANERGDGYALVEIFPKTGDPWAAPFSPGFGDDAVDAIVNFFQKHKRNPPTTQYNFFKDWKKIIDVIPPGSRRWFEYHCWESPESCDAEIWYRSHQKVTVLGIPADQDALTTTPMTPVPIAFEEGIIERNDNAMGLMYIVRFDDGLEWKVFEDELSTTKKDWFRPDPPKRKNPKKKKRKPLKAPEELPTFKDRKRWRPLNKHIGGGYTRGLTITTSIGKYHIHQLMNGYWGGIFEPKRKRGKRVGKYERLVIRDKDGIHDVFRTMGDVRKAAILHYNWYVRY